MARKIFASESDSSLKRDMEGDIKQKLAGRIDKRKLFEKEILNKMQKMEFKQDQVLHAQASSTSII